MLDLALLTGIGLICLSMLLVLVRVLRGPTLPDRIVALDALYVNAIALIILLGIAEADQVYFESALLIALIGFASTVALAKFALRGDVME
jgi:multicomponent K+:H+ antiporter subunit F